MTRRWFLFLLVVGAWAFVQSPLPAMVGTWVQPLAAVSAPPPDPVVHCATAQASTFLRRSDCLAVEGRIEEPGWARAR